MGADFGGRDLCVLCIRLNIDFWGREVYIVLKRWVYYKVASPMEALIDTGLLIPRTGIAR